MLGLKHEVQLCAGTIDCISSMLSANAVHPGDNAVVLGTSLNWGVIHKGLSRNANMISMPYAIEAEKSAIHMVDHPLPGHYRVGL